jgi:hypothetical protein
MALSDRERQAYQARLARLEQVVERVGAELIAARAADPGVIRRLHERLEAADIEIELIRELLDDRDGLTAA